MPENHDEWLQFFADGTCTADLAGAARYIPYLGEEGGSLYGVVANLQGLLEGTDHGSKVQAVTLDEHSKVCITTAYENLLGRMEEGRKLTKDAQFTLLMSELCKVLALAYTSGDVNAFLLWTPSGELTLNLLSCPPFNFASQLTGPSTHQPKCGSLRAKAKRRKAKRRKAQIISWRRSGKEVQDRLKSIEQRGIVPQGLPRL